jgi:peptide/nickel transport system permease protein
MPENAVQALQKAQHALQSKHGKEAHYWAALAVKEDPSLVEAWLILAAVNKPQQSKMYLEKALQIDPENRKALSDLGRVEQKMREEPADKRFTHDTTQIPLSELRASVKQYFRSARKRHAHSKRSLGKLRWQSVVAVLLCTVFIGIAIAAPLLAPPDDAENPSYYRQISSGVSRKPQAPSQAAPLGTVDRSYDVYYSMIWGTRQSLIFGLSTALLTAFIGTLIGTISAYLGGNFDNIVMRITDAFLSFPIICAVALFSQLQALLSPEQYGAVLSAWGSSTVDPNLIQKVILNTNPIFLALVLFSWMPYARIVHTQVLEIKQTQYIDAAHVVGVRGWRIIWKHIIPNAISPIIVLATRDIGRMVIIQATFTYIGLGGDSAWTTILQLGSKWIIGSGGSLFNHWWVYLPITLMLVLFSLSWNLLGDELNVHMNPLANGIKY